MNIRYRPSIDPGGVAASASANAVSTYARYLVEPPADRQRHPAAEFRMAASASIATANINGSTQPQPTSPHCLAQRRSPKAGTAAQIP